MIQNFTHRTYGVICFFFVKNKNNELSIFSYEVSCLPFTKSNLFCSNYRQNLQNRTYVHPSSPLILSHPSHPILIDGIRSIMVVDPEKCNSNLKYEFTVLFLLNTKGKEKGFITLRKRN